MRSFISQRTRSRLHQVIYEADTPAGKLFDVILLILILISIIAVMLDSVVEIHTRYGDVLQIVEWIITLFFTVEYVGRIVSISKPSRYIFSFYGLIDLLATLPAYVDLIFPGWHFLLALRAVRLLRVFRILKLVHFVGAGNTLLDALRKSRNKIAVFLFAVIVICIILGTIMYMVEGAESGFTSIPTSVYWTIVTLTTVGFGDITPVTPLGQFISVIIMILGYGIIAVPTGLITAQFMSKGEIGTNTQSCPHCSASYHRDDAEFCYNCGTKLNRNA